MNELLAETEKLMVRHLAAVLFWLPFYSLQSTLFSKPF
jgi:hypothetical protein